VKSENFDLNYSTKPNALINSLFLLKYYFVLHALFWFMKHKTLHLGHLNFLLKLLIHYVIWQT